MINGMRTLGFNTRESSYRWLWDFSRYHALRENEATRRLLDNPLCQVCVNKSLPEGEEFPDSQYIL
jgi:hypothetical protein